MDIGEGGVLMSIELEEDWIDVEAIKGVTKQLCPWGLQKVWVGFSTHILSGLVQSCLFSSPSHIFQMEAYGSKGKHVSHTDHWGEGVGYVNGQHETRKHFWKKYSILNEPPLSIKQLRAEFGAHLVKQPVVHFIYMKRGKPPQYMLWRYSHSSKSNFAIPEGDRKALKDLARDDFEEYFTLDIYAASEIKLSSEDYEIAVQNAHSWEYIYDYIHPVIMTAHGQPSAHARLEFPQAPKVVTKVVPVLHWTRNTF
jgi:hypothetical protein